MSTKTPVHNPWNSVKEKVLGMLSKATELDTQTLEGLMEVPPDSALGDLATTVAFYLAKKLKKNPAQIASELIEKISESVEREPLVNRIESKGPYVNVFVHRAEFAKLVIESINKLTVSYGTTSGYSGNRVLIEFPAVNPSKPWHIGHTRNAVIGDTLSNVLEWTGYDVVRIDYINDLGLQIAQLTWKLMQIEENPGDTKYDHYLGHLYVEVQEIFEKDKKVEEEIREVARQLEDLNSPAAKTSGIMVTDCVKAQCQTAYRLGIFHNYQVWESAIAHSGLLDAAKKSMLECENIEMLEEGEKAGCIVAKLDRLDEFKDMKDPNKVLFRSDGTRTYTGADVALQMWKFGILKDPFKYTLFENQPNEEDVFRTSITGDENGIGDIDLVFNVIATRQAHPQKLVYTILDLLGHEKQSENSHHIAFEFVGLEGVDFSGREGTWIGYSCDEVLDKAKELALEEVSKRNPDESDEFKESVAEQVGIGAVRYMLLKASPDRKITFKWEEALDFNGDAAPYLQYAHARAQRILEKADTEITESSKLELLISDAEFELIKAMSKLPEEVLEVVRGLTKDVWGTGFTSNRLTAYTYGLATLYSRFYDTSPVLKVEQDLKEARLALVHAFKTTIANSLRILGIPVVDRM
ncbi:MAG: arginine--tRNA ligase [Candidatus Thorarchaeota archaeon]